MGKKASGKFKHNFMRKRQSKPAISVKRVVISKLLKASSDAEILKSIRSGSTGINVTHSGQSLINVGGWIGAVLHIRLAESGRLYVGMKKRLQRKFCLVKRGYLCKSSLA